MYQNHNVTIFMEKQNQGFSAKIREICEKGAPQKKWRKAGLCIKIKGFSFFPPIKREWPSCSLSALQPEQTGTGLALVFFAATADTATATDTQPIWAHLTVSGYCGRWGMGLWKAGLGQESRAGMG